jgi:hypothetical protein
MVSYAISTECTSTRVKAVIIVVVIAIITLFTKISIDDAIATTTHPDSPPCYIVPVEQLFDVSTISN